MNVPAKISVQQAARMMGKSDLYVREAIKRELFDWGYTIKMPGSSRYSYYIAPAGFLAFLGVKPDEIPEETEEQQL